MSPEPGGMSLGVGIMLVSAILLAYVYGGYMVLLRATVRLLSRDTRPAAPPSRDEDLPSLTVYFSALNEVRQVEERIENLLQQDYPPGKLEILIISDGSTDGTADRVRAMAAARPDRQIRVVEFPRNLGTAAAQNEAARTASNPILVSTGAATRFSPGCLRAIAAVFAHSQVAVAGGALHYQPLNSAISEGIRTYRKMEMELRRCEDLLGVMTKTDGACTAYRRAIWGELEEFEDVDHAVVLMARKHGCKAAYVQGAECVDVPNSRWRQEIQARARMTRKGLLTIHKRWGLRDIWRDPLFSLALYSHRHAKYLSPFLIVSFCASAACVTLAAGAAPYVGVAMMMAAFAAGFPSLRRLAGVDRLARMAGSFMLGNAGFGLGVLRWLAGDRTGKFTPSRDLG